MNKEQQMIKTEEQIIDEEELEELKVLIELSLSVEAAKKVIEDNTDFKTTKEKINFLKETFDCKMVSISKEASDEDLYEWLLNAIITIK